MPNFVPGCEFRPRQFRSDLEEPQAATRLKNTVAEGYSYTSFRVTLKMELFKNIPILELCLLSWY